MRSRSEMYSFQKAMVALACKKRQLAMLLEPGYGKTVSTFTTLLDLGAWPALVIAPQRVARQVWPAEPAQWDHLRNIEVRYVGDGLRDGFKNVRGPDGKLVKRVKVRDGSFGWGEPSHVECISYEQLWDLSEHVDLSERYRAVVFDELSQMKTPGAKRFIRMRHAAEDIPIRFGLTGDPVPNHLLDLWGEMFMVAGEKPLGPRFTDFKDRYFATTDYMGYNYELKHSPMCAGYDAAAKDFGAKCNCTLARELEAEIHRRVKPFCYVLPKQREVTTPAVVTNVIELEWPAKVARMAEELERQLWTELDSGTELEALSASAVATKLRQLSGGSVYTDEAGLSSGPRTWEPVHDLKLNALEDLLDELQGEPTLIFYWYQHEAARIEAVLKRRLGTTRWAHGASIDNCERWNKRQLEALLLHPQGAAHGLNLQRGGHNVIWFQQPYSHELFNQGNKRLARLLQPHPVVSAHVLCMGRVDRRVLGIVAGKGDVERRFFDALAA